MSLPSVSLTLGKGFNSYFQSAPWLQASSSNPKKLGSAGTKKKERQRKGSQRTGRGEPPNDFFLSPHKTQASLPALAPCPLFILRGKMAQWGTCGVKTGSGSNVSFETY